MQEALEFWGESFYGHHCYHPRLVCMYEVWRMSVRACLQERVRVCIPAGCASELYGGSTIKETENRRTKKTKGWMWHYNLGDR